ncbi:MAG: hypothetical protein JRI80_01125 [Deltaproteobacteria bacterium]|nr:hypothetical protein [Deltaproteobacteria bacterium]
MLLRKCEKSEGSYAAGFGITGTLRRVLVEKPPLRRALRVAGCWCK